MAHLNDNPKKLLSRVRRIKGQTEAVEKALVSGADCHAVLQQIAAIRGAVNGLMLELLDEHIREHLGGDISADQRQREIELVVSALRSYMK